MLVIVFNSYVGSMSYIGDAGAEALAEVLPVMSQLSAAVASI